MKIQESAVKSYLTSCKAVREYKRGREKNFFLWSNKRGEYFLDKVTSVCSFCVKCGSENDVLDYISTNNFKMVALHV